MKLPLFAARALKYWRSEFGPTYVGLQHLIANSKGIDLNTLVLDAARARDPHTHHVYHSYKGANARGTLLYRQCIASGAMTALLESAILTQLSQQAAFAKAKYVYSHRWAPPTSDGMFCHFMSGYRQRHASVAQALATETGLVAIVADLSNCYGNIELEASRKIFQGRVLASQLSKSEKELALWFTSSLAGFSNPPVGAPIGHVLSQLWLEKLDRLLERRHPGRYARYVDDLVIVCPRQEARHALTCLDDDLRRLGLQRNDEKTHILRPEEWHSEVGSDAALGPLRPFALGGIKKQVRILLAEDPDARHQLRNVLRSEGFGLSTEPTFTDVLNPADVRAGARELRSRRIETIRRSALVCRGAYLHRFHLQADRFDRLKSPTRWDVQQVRNVAMPLLNLLPANDWGQIRSALPAIPAFRDAHAAVSALAESNPREVLAYPGPTADRLSDLWNAHGLATVTLDPAREKGPTFDALVQLTLGGVVRLQSSGLRRLPLHRRELLCFAEGVPAVSRELRNNGYVDELRSLQMGPAARPAA